MRDTRRTRLGLGLLLLVGFILITVDAQGAKPGAPGPLARARTVAASVFGPVERGAHTAAGSVGSLFDGWGHSGSDRAQIKSLQAQVAALKGQAETASETTAQTAQLGSLQKITSLGGLTTVPAQLVGDAQRGQPRRGGRGPDGADRRGPGRTDRERRADHVDRAAGRRP